MDTAQKVSASTITDFVHTEDEVKEQGSRYKPKHSHTPEPHEMYPPFLPAGYYPYYLPPLPPAPTLNYAYMKKHLPVPSGLLSYPPLIEGLLGENNSKDCQMQNCRMQRDEKRDCDCSHRNDAMCNEFFCGNCKRHLRCSYCKESLAASNYPCTKPNCCQAFLPLHSIMHFQHTPVLSCNCACQKENKVKTQQKSKKNFNKNKYRKIRLQPDQDNIPERDNPQPARKQKLKNENNYNIDNSCDSSDSDENCSEISQLESKRENSESDSKSDEERRFGFYVGEGDEDKTMASVKKSGVKNRVKKTRRSLAYFINV